MMESGPEKKQNEIQMEGLASSDRNGGKEFGCKGRWGIELEEKGWRNALLMGVGIVNQQSLLHKEIRVLHFLPFWIMFIPFLSFISTNNQEVAFLRFD